MRFKHVVTGLMLAASAWAAPAHAQSAEAAAPTCKDFANEIVQRATTGVLKDAVEENPELKKLTDEQLVLTAGPIFLKAERPDFKSYGYMMLLWYGGQKGRDLVAQMAPKLETEADRAHYYFVLGMHQIRSNKPDIAATGRDYIRQMRDSGKVEFVNDAMWTGLIDECRLPS